MNKMKRVLICLLFALTVSPLWAPDRRLNLPPNLDDPYFKYFTYCLRNVDHWNPSISNKEMDDFCWSSWVGTQGDQVKCVELFHVALTECGMQHMDNKEGLGYYGATWATILRALKEHEGRDFKDGGWWRWSELHPFEVNEALAAYYIAHGMNPRRWHNASNPGENSDYSWKVWLIRYYCEHGKVWKPKIKRRKL